MLIAWQESLSLGNHLVLVNQVLPKADEQVATSASPKPLALKVVHYLPTGFQSPRRRCTISAISSEERCRPQTIVSEWLPIRCYGSLHSFGLLVFWSSGLRETQPGTSVLTTDHDGDKVDMLSGEESNIRVRPVASSMKAT